MSKEALYQRLVHSTALSNLNEGLGISYQSWARDLLQTMKEITGIDRWKVMQSFQIPLEDMWDATVERLIAPPVALLNLNERAKYTITSASLQDPSILGDYYTPNTQEIIVQCLLIRPSITLPLEPKKLPKPMYIGIAVLWLDTYRGSYPETFHTKWMPVFNQQELEAAEHEIAHPAKLLQPLAGKIRAQGEPVWSFDAERRKTPNYKSSDELALSLRLKTTDRFNPKTGSGQPQQWSGGANKVLGDLPESAHQFKGSFFEDDNGTRFNVERVVSFAASNPDYFHPNLPVSKVVHDLEWWEKDKSPDRDKHMASVDTSYPILVIQDPDGSLSVADGLNRLKKATALEHKDTLPAYVVPKKDIAHLGEKKESVQQAKPITESPIEIFAPIGNWEKNSGFKDVDRRIITSPKAVEKIKDQWNKTPYNFDLYFANIPRLNKEEFAEVGEVDLKFVRYDMQLDLIDIPAINQGSITVIFTNNKGAERVMFTGWIMAHRLGHALRLNRAGSGQTAGLWQEYVQTLNSLFLDILNNLYEHSPRIVDIFGNEFQKNTAALRLASQQLGTMKSARDQNLRTWFEFAYELFAQYLLTGKITFNPLPEVLQTGYGAFGRKETKRAGALERENFNIERYREALENALKRVLNSAVGKIFVM